MTARDWLMRQNPARRPRMAVPQASEGFAALIDAVAAERSSAPVAAMRAQPVPDPPERFTEAAVTSARAPWVPPEQVRPLLSIVETARLDAAFDRRPDCRVCDIRYSHCYPFNHGGRRA